MTKKKFATTKDLVSLLGFLMVGLGILAIILSLVGARFTFMAWLDHWGAGVGFVLRLIMVIVGFVIIFVNKSESLYDSET